MVTLDDIRRVALPLPRTSENVVREWVKFRIGRIVYVSVSPDESVMGFAFPKEERDALVASEPTKFHLPDRRNLRYNWVHAWTGELDAAELGEIVVDAWRMCVPRGIADAHLSGRDR